ncbi:MAG: MG2 domain-containing protein [Bacteroidales bacterium]|nr:MG2 domain-containing protein [Bacteroidales bacterium]
MKKISPFLFKISIYFLSLFISNTFSLTGFSQDQKIYPDFEEIYIHTDKDIYTPGEDIWFKAYILDDEYHIPSGKSKLLYINIVDFEGNNILSEKLPIQSGFSNGDFQLPDTLKKGNYQIVAYTENMKNNSSAFWYHSEITINPSSIDLWKINYYPKLSKLSKSVIAGEINCTSYSNMPITDATIQFAITSESKKIYSKTHKTYSLGVAKISWEIPDNFINDEIVIEIEAKYLNKKKDLKINIPFQKKGIDLKFFPEGGSIVQGLLNQVAFKVNDNYGSPIDIKGILLNQKGEQLKKIKTTYQGLGIFSFTPNPNESYYVKIKNPNFGDSLYALPKAIKSGYILSVGQNDKSIISLRISMTPDMKGKKVKLSISNGVEYENIFESILNDEKRFSFLTSSLPVGISTITLFSDDIPTSERLIFLNKHKKMQLSIETEKEIYDPREKVEIQIKALDFEGNPTSANLSLAVTEKNKLMSEQQNIASWLLLGSKLKAITGDLSYYLKDTEAADSALNILLMTHGWSKIERIEEYSKIIVNSENIPGIRGTVYTKKNKPAKNAQVQIIDTKTWQVISTETNDFGRFSIPIEDYISVATNNDLSISATLPNKSKILTIVLDQNINNDILAKFKINEDIILAYNLPEKRRPIKNNTATEYTNFDKTTEFIDEVVVTGKRFDPVYDEARKNVYAVQKLEGKEMELLRKMGEPKNSLLTLIRSAGATFKVINGRVIFRSRSSLVTAYETGALIVVDGVPMGDNISNFSWISPINVKEVKVTTSPGSALMYGSSYKGLVEITMLKGNENINKQVNIKNDENLSVIKGYKISKQFYSPDYSKEIENNEKTFDSRSTLYWNPNLILDNSGEQTISFFNGDKRTFFQCKVVGTDGAGLLGCSEITVRVN